MTTSQRILAFLAYLLSVVGWLVVLVLGRRDRFALYHVRQSMALHLLLVAVTLAWAVVAWATSWIPFLFLLGMAAFSLVLAVYVYGVALWVMGMRNALRGRAAPLPVVGAWARRLPVGSRPGAALRAPRLP